MTLFSDPVEAGFPSPADGVVEKQLDLNELMVVHPAATFFVRVKGRSMEQANIFEGDILVVDRALPPTDGKIVLAILNGAFTVKRLKIEGKKVTLQAENPDFPSIPVPPDADFQVWGVVTYVIHKP
jgi:DNA polymerase V